MTKIFCDRCGTPCHNFAHHVNITIQFNSPGATALYKALEKLPTDGNADRDIPAYLDPEGNFDFSMDLCEECKIITACTIVATFESFALAVRS